MISDVDSLDLVLCHESEAAVIYNSLDPKADSKFPNASINSRDEIITVVAIGVAMTQISTFECKNGVFYEMASCAQKTDSIQERFIESIQDRLKYDSFVLAKLHGIMERILEPWDAIVKDFDVDDKNLERSVCASIHVKFPLESPIEEEEGREFKKIKFEDQGRAQIKNEHECNKTEPEVKLEGHKGKQIKMEQADIEKEIKLNLDDEASKKIKRNHDDIKQEANIKIDPVLLILHRICILMKLLTSREKKSIPSL